jgi:hypothetical protein
MRIHEGSCFCGRVKLEVSGAPVAQGYCHCADCQAWLGVPVNALAVWPADAVVISQGADLARSDYDHGRGISKRIWCSHCGGGLGNRKPKSGMTVAGVEY